jgi:HAD superfamily hydrolase (TIGR01450 family)
VTLLKNIETTTIWNLVERYSVLLFDAYGVLVDEVGAMGGAPPLIEHLNKINKPYFILTNDASRTPAASVPLYNSFGLAIKEERIISAGLVLRDYFEANSLQGARCFVLGTKDSEAYVAQAGGEVIPLQESAEVDAIILGDQTGFDLLKGLDKALNAIIYRVERDLPIALILTNPDFMYPVSKNKFGVGTGVMAAALEQALAVRFIGQAPIKFIALGKPYRPIFEKAALHAGTMDMLMVGDQLLTDIKGANDFGIDSALVLSGVTDPSVSITEDMPTPTYFISSLIER